MAKKSPPAKKPAVKSAPPRPLKFEGEVMARAAAEYADNKKAEDIVILDVRGISPVTDYFVICTASSAPHLRAVRDEVQDMFRTGHGVRPLARDENLESLWLILHYGDVMVHIFQREKREFYALEELWNDAERVDWSPLHPPPPQKAARKPAGRKARGRR